MDWLKSQWASWKVKVSVVGGVLVVATAYGTCQVDPGAVSTSTTTETVEVSATTETTTETATGVDTTTDSETTETETTTE